MDKESENVFVSILRRPEGLFAYLVERREPFETPGSPPPGAESDLQAIDPYIERVVPLRDLPRAKSGPLKSALDSWETLGAVEQLDGTVLFHLVNVLLHSIPDETSGKFPSPLIFPPEPPVFRPSAARPRAYRGTKDRPPKSRQRRRMDLRRHLASPRDVNELILRLAPCSREAGRLLKKEDTLSRDLPPLVDPKSRVQDVYAACLHPGSKESILSLPPLFRRGFLFWRRGEPWRNINRLLGLFWGLELEKRPPLRRCLERLWTLAPFSETMEWCELILEQPEERRAAFAELVVESDLRWRDCPTGLGAILKTANDLIPDLYYRHWMHVLLAGLKKGVDHRYLLSGLELAQLYDQRPSFEVVEGDGPAPVDTIKALVDHTAAKYLAMTLWDACGKLAGFSTILQYPPWQDLSPESAKELLYLVANAQYWTDLEPDLKKAKWAVLCNSSPVLIDLVQDIPEGFQAKAIRHLKEILWYWDTPEALAWALSEYQKVLPRICRPPFLEKGFEQRLLAVLTNLARVDWERIREGPDDLFRAFEKACRRDNDAILIAGGLRFLALEQSELVTKAILEEPVAVLKTAERLGGLGGSLRRKVLNQWMAHPLLHDGLLGLPTEKLLGLLLKHVPAELSSAIPRKLKDHLAGRATLTQDQLERGRNVVLSALTGVRWRLLGHLCVVQVSDQLRPRGGSANVVHAVRFYGHIDENRRALRKFLRAYFQGDADYLHQHPRNQEWLRRQERLNPDVWLGGMETTGTLRDGSTVRLHIELDPLEALRLGTYVGSCTGLGGSFAYSAAAVVLDLNKHVVYARNEQGAVLGRQLIAVSKEEQLVVFDVYPRSVSAELKRLFRSYDLELAGRLGLEIHKPGEENVSGGKVELLLSKEWWDDGAWDPTDDEEATSEPADAP